MSNESFIILVTLLAVVIFLELIIIFVKNSVIQSIKKRFKNYFNNNLAQDAVDTVGNLTEAINYLCDNSKGSIVIIQKNNNVIPYLMESQSIDSVVNRDLIINIFGGAETQPLHDGAIVISGNRITLANAFVKKLSNNSEKNQYGSRHRAAIGITEQTDAISIITSEERKTVSIASQGNIRTVDKAHLFDTLSEYIIGIQR